MMFIIQDNGKMVDLMDLEKLPSEMDPSLEGPSSMELLKVINAYLLW